MKSFVGLQGSDKWFQSERLSNVIKDTKPVLKGFEMEMKHVYNIVRNLRTISPILTK